MDDFPPFAYVPRCSAPRCQRPAVFKVAAPWSNGTSRELKNYGLACDRHGPAQLARARARSQGLTPAEGETVGPVGLYRLEAGRRDAALTRLPDPGG